jgi:hypothetical protein
VYEKPRLVVETSDGSGVMENDTKTSSLTVDCIVFFQMEPIPFTLHLGEPDIYIDLIL